MNSIELFNNHYIGNTKKEDLPASHIESDKLTNLAWDLSTFGTKFPYTRLEHQLDVVSNLIIWGNRTCTAILLGLEGSSLFSQFQLSFISPVYAAASVALQILTFPFTVFFIGGGVIQGLYELIQIRRIVALIANLEDAGNTEVEKLQWIAKRYFRLDQREEQTITHYIDGSPIKIDETRQARFERIANKMLSLKEAQLNNRLTPALASALKEQVFLASKELLHADSVGKAKLRTQVLFASAKQEAKLRVVTHIFTLTAVGAGLIGSVLSILAIVHFPTIIALGAVVAICFVLSKAIEWGYINHSTTELYDRLTKLNLELPELSIPSRNWPKWLEYCRNELPRAIGHH